MITNQTQHGEKITINDVANYRLQAYFDALTAAINALETVYTVATVPDAALNKGRSIYVDDETGGATIAFSDGTNWRRVQDRAIIS